MAILPGHLTIQVNGDNRSQMAERKGLQENVDG